MVRRKPVAVVWVTLSEQRGRIAWQGPYSNLRHVLVGAPWFKVQCRNLLDWCWRWWESPDTQALRMMLAAYVFACPATPRLVTQAHIAINFLSPFGLSL